MTKDNIKDFPKTPVQKMQEEFEIAMKNKPTKEREAVFMEAYDVLVKSEFILKQIKDSRKRLKNYLAIIWMLTFILWIVSPYIIDVTNLWGSEKIYYIIGVTILPLMLTSFITMFINGNVAENAEDGLKSILGEPKE